MTDKPNTHPGFKTLYGSDHINKCAHPEIIKPAPPEAPWYDRMPYKCTKCGEQIHATQVEEVESKLKMVDYSKYANKPRRRR